MANVAAKALCRNCTASSALRTASSTKELVLGSPGTGEAGCWLSGKMVTRTPERAARMWRCDYSVTCPGCPNSSFLSRDCAANCAIFDRSIGRIPIDVEWHRALSRSSLVVREVAGCEDRRRMRCTRSTELAIRSSGWGNGDVSYCLPATSLRPAPSRSSAFD